MHPSLNIQLFSTNTFYNFQHYIYIRPCLRQNWTENWNPSPSCNQKSIPRHDWFSSWRRKPTSADWDPGYWSRQRIHADWDCTNDWWNEMRYQGDRRQLYTCSFPRHSPNRRDTTGQRCRIRDLWSRQPRTSEFRRGIRPQTGSSGWFLESSGPSHIRLTFWRWRPFKKSIF